VQQAEIPLRGDLLLAAVADESTPRSVRRRSSTRAGGRGIVTEPTDLQIGMAHRGFAWLEVETLEKQRTAAAGRRASTPTA